MFLHNFAQKQMIRTFVYCFFGIFECIEFTFIPALISMAFFRQTVLRGCYIKCEILRSPMVSYQSLLFIATTMNDTYVCSYKAIQYLCMAIWYIAM